MQLEKPPCPKPTHPLLQKCPRFHSLSFTGQGTHLAQFPCPQVGPGPSSARSAINHSEHTAQVWNFSRKEQVFTVHIPPFFHPPASPEPGRWDGFPPRSPGSIYPWNAVASGRFLPFQLCTSVAQNTKFGLWPGH